MIRQFFGVHKLLLLSSSNFKCWNHFFSTNSCQLISTRILTTISFKDKLFLYYSNQIRFIQSNTNKIETNEESSFSSSSSSSSSSPPSSPSDCKDRTNLINTAIRENVKNILAMESSPQLLQIYVSKFK